MTITTTDRGMSVQVGTGPETIRVLKAALADGMLPDTYVQAGELVHMETVSGGLATEVDEDSPLPVSASHLTPAGLAGLLAEHAYVYRLKTRKGNDGQPEVYEDEVTPPRDILASVLAGKTWPKTAPLRGIIGAPVLRRDGTLLQRPGYDPATGLYLASKVALPPVPDSPPPSRYATPGTSCSTGSYATSPGRPRRTGPTTSHFWLRRSCATTPGP
ncbi:hypothetical protein GCM10027280_27520 [Micromonospora polyrhachis]|uniref:Uncharacterized protein n=1 Tax=Micromonospora polyrhachis TaxID=1282883 RepID=A0A7W7SR99_9ACTN|nr:hypothetical protein [Micromonospora polyrhachis]MBB4959376.1 hypothetical protein [Micromonospora polyrhachis]